jgi:protease I
MSKIAVLITNDFEDSEYSKPAEAFRDAGNQLTHLGIKKGEEVNGKHLQSRVKIDESLRDSSPYEFDAVFIPGGFSPDQLRAHDEAVQFVRDFMETDKPVFAICHGPQLLISAEALEGRTVTGWKSIAQDIKNAGAEFLDQEVVVDGNLITSRSPQDIPAFIQKSLEKLQSNLSASNS